MGIVVAPNFSLGVQLFFRLVRQASRLLAAGALFEPFVVESHHRGKRDAPSGTARRLCQILLDTDPGLTEIVEGNPEGRLPAGVLQVSSVRAGAEPGSHLVGFDGEHERIELQHRARGRSGFALGAVLAAEWLRGHRGMVELDDLVDRYLAGRTTGAGGLDHGA